MPEFIRARHHLVWEVLQSLNASLLAETECYFGGGTRIALEFDEYRESANIDLFCASNSGYRLLRNTISDNSLGEILKAPLLLAREVRADRYGIRTFMLVGTEPVKFEIVSEGRIQLGGVSSENFPLPVLDPESCFAEKYLANADRWNDRGVTSRDVIDLAFMITGWNKQTAKAGFERAESAYGDVVRRSVTAACKHLLTDDAYRAKCVHSLGVTNTRRLKRGLQLLTDI